MFILGCLPKEGTSLSSTLLVFMCCFSEDGWLVRPILVKLGRIDRMWPTGREENAAPPQLRERLAIANISVLFSVG